MNKLITAVLLLAFTSGALAQQKPAAKPAAETKKAAPAKAAPAKAAAKPAEKKAEDPAGPVLEKLKAWDAALQTLKADFTQELNFTEAGLKQTIEGNLRYSRPNLLRIEHIKPSRQLVVTDKKDIWIYKPEDNQVVRASWDAWRRTQDQNFSGILDFGNYAALTEKNTATVSGGKDGAPVTVKFVPKSGKDYSLSLTLSATDYFPLGAELSVEGTVIKTRLTSVEKNGPVDAAVFKFSPPKGAETLEFKN